jgi:hypothetical protein
MDGVYADADLPLLLDSSGLTQFVTCATREDNHLDIFTSSNPTTVTKVQVDDAGLPSDHRLVAA